jgi:hypothetical protein
MAHIARDLVVDQFLDQQLHRTEAIVYIVNEVRQNELVENIPVLRQSLHWS